MKKLLFIVVDGAADTPLDKLDGRTPLDVANTPTMDKLFEEWVGKEYVQTLYEIISYCCYMDYPIHLIFCSRTATLFCLTGAAANSASQLMT